MNRPRVLVVRTGAMGDVLHALPAVAALRQQWPAAVIDWVVDERWAPLLVDQQGVGPVVSRVCPAQTRQWSQAPLSLATLRAVRSLRHALQASPYSCVVDLQGTLRSAVIGRFAASPVRFGFADPRERLALRFYTGALPRRGTHVVEQNAALLGDALRVALVPAVPALPSSASADAWAAAAIPEGPGRFALLVPTAGWGAKQWPAAHFATLARALADRGWTVLLNAAHPDDPVARAVLHGSGDAPPFAQPAQLISPAVDGLIALTRRASLVVGGDTGPVHLAAALGVPTVALFGPTDPARNGPWGAGAVQTLRSPASSTSHKRIATPDPGLASLSVAEVLAAVDRVTG